MNAETYDEMDSKGSDIFGQRGFTLIELLVVVVIIGVLAAIGSANFARMKGNAKMAACISNQRHILETGFAYAIDNVVLDGAMNVTVLSAAGYTQQGLCECPTSNVADFDDYTITWQNGMPVDVDCSVEGVAHDWTPQ